ncbi:MAG: 4-hydroxy-tetrahydrodipicolinate reductase, partial [Nitrososphaerales archaeon]
MTRALRVCLIGATGRMGMLIAREAPRERFEITGAVAAPDDPGVGKRLRDLGAGASDAVVSPPTALGSLLPKSDVCISFVSAQAEMSNLTTVAKARVPFVSGTTGLTPQQRKEQAAAFEGRVPAVITSNFSVGANLLIAMSAALKALPHGFDVSIVESHHSGKADSPSGTALSIAQEVSKARGYTKT